MISFLTRAGGEKFSEVRHCSRTPQWILKDRSTLLAGKPSRFEDRQAVKTFSVTTAA